MPDQRIKIEEEIKIMEDLRVAIETTHEILNKYIDNPNNTSLEALINQFKILIGHVK